MKPITPAEVISKKRETIPAAVFDVFNEAITEAWNGGHAVVNQEHVALSIADRLQISKTEVYDRGYLDIEELYRAAGWTVQYDKPGYNETYPATFKFSK